MLVPVFNAETFHEKGVSNQCDFTAYQSVSLQLIELIHQEQASPSVGIRHWHVVGVVLRLWSLPIDHVDIDGALFKVDLE